MIKVTKNELLHVIKLFELEDKIEYGIIQFRLRQSKLKEASRNLGRKIK